MAGGVMGLLLAPIMVIVKYMTGWAIIPEPAWVARMAVGVSALRRRFLEPWLAWMFVLLFPSAVVASITWLPTTPSGALWLFSLMMIVSGYFLATGRADRLMTA
jgi:hypothetical protein